MRAKFIFEAINFERHQEPLDSLGIGDIERRKGVIRVKKDLELAPLEKWGIDTLLKTSNTHGGIVYIWHIRQGSDLSSIYMGIGYLDGNWRLGYWKKTRFQKGSIHNVLGVKDETWDSLWDTKFEEYEDEIKSNDWIDSSNSDSPKAKAISNYFFYNVKNGYDKKLKESQHFERGGDDLDHLNIGRVQERKLEKMRKQLQLVAMEYDVDINKVGLDNEYLFVDVPISGRRYCIGLSAPFIEGEEDRKEYSVGWQDIVTNDISNEISDTEFSTIQECINWIREEIDLHADTYMNESNNFTREDDPLDSLNIGRVQQRRIDKLRELSLEMMEGFVKSINEDPTKLKNLTIEASKRIPWRISYEILEDVGYTTVRNVYQISYTLPKNMFRVKFYTQDTNDKSYNDLRLVSATYDLDNEDVNSVLEDCRERLLHYFNEYGQYKNS
jgi:hypothetical protein